MSFATSTPLEVEVWGSVPCICCRTPFMHVLRKQKQVVSATGDPQGQGFPPMPPTQP